MFASRLLNKGLGEFLNASKFFKNARFVVLGEFDDGNPDCFSKSLFSEFVER